MIISITTRIHRKARISKSPTRIQQDRRKIQRFHREKTLAIQMATSERNVRLWRRETSHNTNRSLAISVLWHLRERLIWRDIVVCTPVKDPSLAVYVRVCSRDKINSNSIWIRICSGQNGRLLRVSVAVEAVAVVTWCNWVPRVLSVTLPPLPLPLSPLPKENAAGLERWTRERL